MPIVQRIDHGPVEGIQVGRFPGRVNSMVFLYRRGTTLIDTGPPNQWREVAGLIAEQPLDLIVVTHHHEDHAGNASRLARASGVPTLAPELSLDALCGGFPVQAYRRLIWGRPRWAERDLIQPMPESIELPDGSALEAIPLPGHSPDMTCLLDRTQGVLYGADLYIARRLRYLRADEDLAGMIASLERVQAYDFDTLLCGHRGPIPGAKQKLAAKRDALVSLCQETRELRDRGLGIRAITRRLLGREGGMVLASLGHFSKKNLIRACLENR